MIGESIIGQLGNMQYATKVAVIMLCITCCVVVIKITNVRIVEAFVLLVNKLVKVFGRKIYKKETAYKRNVQIGKIKEKDFTYKSYRFFNDLIIDLGMKPYGVTPYQLAAGIMICVAVISAIGCRIVFGNFAMGIIMYPILLTGTICMMYTRANIAHDRRIENVIEAENIICNNIKNGVVVAIRDSIDVLPRELKPEFQKFLDNIEQQNYHVRNALLELNSQLGSISDDFIKKCIVFEMEEEHGIVGMFQDIVEVNNIKMEMRIEMKREFENVKFQVRLGAGMIFIFLAGVLAVFKDVRNFYFTNIIGQIIIALDILVLIGEYVYLTYLRAKEL